MAKRPKCPNDVDCEKIVDHMARLSESMEFMQEGRDVDLHITDMHDQFKAMAAILGYDVTPRVTA